MSAPATSESGKLQLILEDLQRLLLTPTPETLERAAELALSLRGGTGGPGEETLRAIELCRKLAQQAADHYLRLQRALESRTATYTPSGQSRALEGPYVRLDARA